MCGIAGIVRYDDDFERREARVAIMQRSLRHRGPDGEGAFAQGPVALAHTRLALVDREGGAQPVSSPDGRYVLVYNGEVYDVPRAGLAWTPRNRSDAELVLAAWATWGEACLPRLNGMFAFFVWDTHTQQGWLARDLLGVKPLAYAFDDELVFASEAKAVLAARARPRRANRDAILEYLVAPAFSGVVTSMFAGIEYLQPGHVLHVRRDGVSVRVWGTYRPNVGGEIDPDTLRDALATATRRTLTADVPVGIFLSGGLDSSLLAGLADRPLPAYTIAFEAQAHFDYARSLIVTSDDTPRAAEVAQELGLRQTWVRVDRAQLASDLALLTSTNDALPAWEQELAQHHLARVATRDVKAVLVGDAADETHYGYHFLLDDRATRSPGRILERFCDPLIRADILRDPIGHFDAQYRRQAQEAGYDWETDGLDATSWLVRSRWLPRLLHNGDIHCMAHGLEARVPFADLDVLAIAARIGPAQALRGGVEKAALREAARGAVSERVRLRRKSALPKDQDVAPIYQREAVGALEVACALLDIDRVRPLLDPGRTLDERERALLFRTICLSHWARAYEVEL